MVVGKALLAKDCSDILQLPLIQEEAVNDLLCHLDTCKSMEPDGIHPRVPKELAKELAKPLSIISSS